MVAAVTAVTLQKRTPKRLTAAAYRRETQTPDTHPGTRGLPARAAQRVLGRESWRRGRGGGESEGGAYGGRAGLWRAAEKQGCKPGDL